MSTDVLESTPGGSLSLDVQGAASLLALKPPTIRKLVLSRGIPFYRLGRRIVFDRLELLQWRNARRVEPIAAQTTKAAGLA